MRGLTKQEKCAMIQKKFCVGCEYAMNGNCLMLDDADMMQPYIISNAEEGICCTQFKGIVLKFSAATLTEEQLAVLKKNKIELDTPYLMINIMPALLELGLATMPEEEMPTHDTTEAR